MGLPEFPPDSKRRGLAGHIIHRRFESMGAPVSFPITARWPGSPVSVRACLKQLVRGDGVRTARSRA